MRVLYNECDPLGLVFNGNYLVYADVAINELWRAHTGGYENMMKEGLDLAVVEANLRYLSPLRFDDEFDLDVRVDHIGNKSMITVVDLTMKSKDIATITMSYVCIDSESKTSVPIPDSIRDAFTI